MCISHPGYSRNNMVTIGKTIKRKPYYKGNGQKTKSPIEVCCYCHIAVAPFDPCRKLLANGNVCHSYCES